MTFELLRSICHRIASLHKQHDHPVTCAHLVPLQRPGIYHVLQLSVALCIKWEMVC